MDLHGGFCFVGFPLGGSCHRPRPLTDEGQVYSHHPLAGYDIDPPPHPASGGASATFPRPRGKAFLFRQPLLHEIEECLGGGGEVLAAGEADLHHLVGVHRALHDAGIAVLVVDGVVYADA